MKKRYIVMVAAMLLFSSCARNADFVIDLRAETEAVFAKEDGVSVIINKNSQTFHLDEDCSYLSRMKDENRLELAVESAEMLLQYGYHPCGRCAKTTEKDVLP
jgi:hypothetical protein